MDQSQLTELCNGLMPSVGNKLLSGDHSISRNKLLDTHKSTKCSLSLPSTAADTWHLNGREDKLTKLSSSGSDKRDWSDDQKINIIKFIK